MPTLKGMLLVALGAALGGSLRYVVASLVSHQTGTGFPWGTLVVNLTGCLLIGCAVPLLLDLEQSRHGWSLLLVVGVLGGYTTLSAFALETLRLYRADRGALAAAYMIATNTGAMICIVLGVQLGRLAERWLHTGTA